jgi:hypothetical protein
MKSSNTTSPQPMSTAQSVESLREHAAHKPISGDRQSAAAILAAAKTITGLEAQIAEIQVQIDAIPAQEAAIVDDRSKSPADVRAELAVLSDRKSDLRLQQKRLEDDKANKFAEAVALLPQCAPLVAGYFAGIYEAQRAKAVAAVAPFFAPGASVTPESIADELPTVAQARTNAAYALERVKGENPQEVFRKYVEVITEFGLDKSPAA